MAAHEVVGPQASDLALGDAAGEDGELGEVGGGVEVVGGEAPLVHGVVVVGHVVVGVAEEAVELLGLVAGELLGGPPLAAAQAAEVLERGGAAVEVGEAEA